MNQSLGNLIKPAVYARVSSDQQAQQRTIDSQCVELRQRVDADGLALEEELLFADDGYSGSSLLRPALERLRDLAYGGVFQRLYVHSPDRLARKYVHQMVLLEELQENGVEVVFLNQAMDSSPEGQLLLQMQGMIAEYERAKIVERTRRGRRHVARRGLLNAIAHAPYGYRYISKHQAGGEAYYQVVPREAELVRQIFEWVGRDRLTLGGVARRLHELGVPSPKGNEYWNRGSLGDLLKNSAYQGLATFGKTRKSERLSRLRPPRGGSETPRRSHTWREAPASEQIGIPVPAIVSPELFTAVQEQLAENRQRAREQRHSAAQYLLQGLTLCGCCGSAYCGKHGRKVGRQACYRCVGTENYRFGGHCICRNRQVQATALEAAVWQDVQEVLRDPAAIRQEYERRLGEEDSQDSLSSQQLQRQIAAARRSSSRLIDAYTDDLLSKADFEPRIQEVKSRLARLEAQAAAGTEQASLRAELQQTVSQFQKFSDQIGQGLENADWITRREIIRTLVKAVKIDSDDVKITYRINPHRETPRPERGRRVQHCRHSQPLAGG